jgi:hypothetical protein
MLPAEYRDAIVLHHLEGCTIQQVAEVMGSPVGTTAARLSRARAMMRERLSWRGVVMTDAMITAFVVGELLREPVSESVATRAAMAGAATATEAASVTIALTACVPATAVAPIAPPLVAIGPVLYAGSQVKQWVAVACVAALLGGGTVAVMSSAATGTTRVRATGSASVERTSRSAARAPFLSFESTGKVPEPSSLGVLAMGGLLLLRRHRRRNRSS